MYTEKINIAIAERDVDERIFFSTVLNDLKIPNSYEIFDDGEQLLYYLKNTLETPHLILLNVDHGNANGGQSLGAIRRDPKFNDTCIAVYTTESAEDKITGMFIAGANIYIEKPETAVQFEKIIRQIVSVNWQYVVDGLDREKFVLKF
jgi:CheY-like chemotaxis protein